MTAGRFVQSGWQGTLHRAQGAGGAMDEVDDMDGMDMAQDTARS